MGVVIRLWARLLTATEQSPLRPLGVLVTLAGAVLLAAGAVGCYVIVAAVL